MSDENLTPIKISKSTKLLFQEYRILLYDRTRIFLKTQNDIIAYGFGELINKEKELQHEGDLNEDKGARTVSKQVDKDNSSVRRRTKRKGS